MLLLQRPLVLRVITSGGFAAGLFAVALLAVLSPAVAAPELYVALCPVPLSLVTPEGNRTLTLHLYPDGSCTVSAPRFSPGHHRAAGRRGGLRIHATVVQSAASEKPGCFFFKARTYCE